MKTISEQKNTGWLFGCSTSKKGGVLVCWHPVLKSEVWLHKVIGSLKNEEIDSLILRATRKMGFKPDRRFKGGFRRI